MINLHLMNGTAPAQKPRCKEEHVEFNSKKWKGEQTSCRAVARTVSTGSAF